MSRKFTLILVLVLIMTMLCACGKTDGLNEGREGLQKIYDFGNGFSFSLYADKDTSVVYLLDGYRITEYYILDENGNPHVARYNFETKELY